MTIEENKELIDWLKIKLKDARQDEEMAACKLRQMRQNVDHWEERLAAEGEAVMIVQEKNHECS
jgi:hypothetical protein